MKKILSKKPLKKTSAHKSDISLSKNSSLNEFYTKEQIEREKVEQIEKDVFEHMKKHTKKLLDRK